MKIRLLAIFAVVLFVAASCGGGHRTCATYLKNTKEVKQERF